MRSTISIILLALSLATAAQIPRQVFKSIPNGTNVLNIETADNFSTILEKLLNSGFEIEKYDETLGTITTAWKPLPRTGTYKLNIRIKNGQITVRGQLKSGISIEIYGARTEDSPEDIRKVGSQKGVYGMAFNEMFSFAQKLGKVTW